VPWAVLPNGTPARQRRSGHAVFSPGPGRTALFPRRRVAAWAGRGRRGRVPRGGRL